MDIRTTVSLAISADTDEQHRRIAAAFSKAERDLIEHAVLRGVQVTEVHEVDRVMAVVDFDENARPYARSVRTMSDAEIAEWLVENNQGLPPLLLVTFEATVVSVPARAA